MGFNLERFDIDIFVFLDKFLLDFLNNLVYDVVDVSSTFWCTYSIYEWHLPELAIWKRDYYLPAIIISVLISDFYALIVAWKVHVYVLQKRIYFKLISIQNNLHAWKKTSHIINSLLHDWNDVLVKFFHLESFELRIEGNCCVVFPRVVFYLRVTVRRHILSPDHLKLFSWSSIATLYDKFMRKDVC